MLPIIRHFLYRPVLERMIAELLQFYEHFCSIPTYIKHLEIAIMTFVTRVRAHFIRGDLNFVSK
jgi:hypothetical protein